MTKKRKHFQPSLQGAKLDPYRQVRRLYPGGVDQHGSVLGALDFSLTPTNMAAKTVLLMATIGR